MHLFIYKIRHQQNKDKIDNIKNTKAGKSLNTERKKAKAKILYKILNKMGPKSLANLFSHKSEKTVYNLRGISSSLCLQKRRTNNMKNSFMYDGANLWNSIPCRRY